MGGFVCLNIFRGYMSSAGTIFRESTQSIQADGPGTKKLLFDIENDGALVVIERLSGNGLITGSLRSILPEPMTPLELAIFEIDSNQIQLAYITSRTLQISLGWVDGIDVKVSVKAMSGEGVAAWLAQRVIATTVSPRIVSDTATEIISSLGQLIDLQTRSLNHLREITNLENEGDIF